MIAKNFRKLSWALVAAALLGGSSLLAADTLTLTGVGNNGILGGVYVGPYVGTINGGVPTAIICDDFFDDTYFNESWMATETDLSNLTGTRFGAANLVQYEQAAWLANQLINPATTCPMMTAANCAADVQFAIWQVFDNTGSNQPFGQLTGNDAYNASWWLTQAQGQTYTAGQFSNVTIYTPTSCLTNCGPAGTLPQEFLTVTTPEPPEVALLGVDLLGVGALFLVFRRVAARKRAS